MDRRRELGICDATNLCGFPLTTMTAVAPASPAYLAATWRYVGDDWSGSNALTYQVWTTPPVPAVYAADGVTVVTPAVAGVPYNLTGCAVSGTLRYTPRPFGASGAAPFTGLATPTGSIVGAPIAGTIALSVLRGTTVSIPRQDMSVYGQPGTSLLLAQPMITDATGMLVTVGVQPVWVF